LNRVQRFREAALMAKAELARKAGVSESTIDRVEAGHDCRMETKRKILFALGLTLQDSQKLFPKNGARTRVAAR
jgi:DNA-binding XRE family transcriptional regulator